MIIDTVAAMLAEERQKQVFYAMPQLSNNQSSASQVLYGMWVPPGRMSTLWNDQSGWSQVLYRMW
jgi:hypothetical protein